MLTRFRWWLARKLCPRMRLVIRVGKQMTPERFAAVKIYHHDLQVVPITTIDIARFRQATPTAEMAIVDAGTVAEGQCVDDEFVEGHDPNYKQRSKEEMQDLLRDALKGTSLEGFDKKPGPKLL